MERPGPSLAAAALTVISGQLFNSSISSSFGGHLTSNTPTDHRVVRGPISLSLSPLFGFVSEREGVSSALSPQECQTGDLCSLPSFLACLLRENAATRCHCMGSKVLAITHPNSCYSTYLNNAKTDAFSDSHFKYHKFVL